MLFIKRHPWRRLFKETEINEKQLNRSFSPELLPLATTVY